MKSKHIVSDSTFINELIRIFDEFEEMVKICFKGDTLFQRAMRNAFEGFMNRELGKFQVAEILAVFCDKILKKGSKLTEKQTEVYV